ncbi:hypothetical protein BBK14_08260 [Parafrankia soli]|uniref:Uncharacterized protein n=1 Tax=Parafrankia soli TaxID=2599596 RepID=A0A1S1PGA0_9ACTN|nr:hypothetical protein BBK14_08260 [Parafrankia soli]
MRALSASSISLFTCILESADEQNSKTRAVEFLMAREISASQSDPGGTSRGAYQVVIVWRAK